MFTIPTFIFCIGLAGTVLSAPVPQAGPVVGATSVALASPPQAGSAPQALPVPKAGPVAKVSTAQPSTIPRGTVPFVSPTSTGGSQLDVSGGLGEPLNVIISALSSPAILTKAGLEKWALSIGFSKECLGLHIGNPQTANLGDGRGQTNELGVRRQDFSESLFGSCIESITGGNHYRFWQQSTTGAWFLAVSEEEPSSQHHMIKPNGYDIGRDTLVAEALSAGDGKTKHDGVTYTTTVQMYSGLLQPGTKGINHAISIDGNVAVLTIITS